jgi:hypothetical protein
MDCFVALDEDTILRLWALNPHLVSPFCRPFYSSAEPKALSFEVLAGQSLNEKHDAHVACFHCLCPLQLELSSK